GGETRFDYNVPNLKAEGWNDRLSSFRVLVADNAGRNGRYERRDERRDDRRGISSFDVDRIIRRAYQDILDREPDQEGLRTYRSHMIDDGWTEAQVRESLRTSREAREKNTMTYEKANEIVRRAYLNVLNREPDPGAVGYVNRVLRDHWTQADVERELRRS